MLSFSDCNGTLPTTQNPSGQLSVNQTDLSKLTGVKCTWNIVNNDTSKYKSPIRLRIQNFLLSPHDLLVISDNEKKVGNFTLTGFKQSGIVFTGSNNIIIELIVNEAAFRVFDVYYNFTENKDVIDNVDQPGSVFIGYTNNSNVLKDPYTLILEIHKQINGKSLWINFDNITKGVTVNAKNALNVASTENLVGEDLISNGTRIELTIENSKSFKELNLTVNYDLVNTDCSKNITLDDFASNRCTRLNIPDDAALANLPSFKCLFLVKHSDANGKINFDLFDFNFPNSDDTIQIKDGNRKSSKDLIISSLEFLFWVRTQYIVSSGNSMWVLYNSPKVINKKKPQQSFCVNGLKYGGTFDLEKDMNLVLTKDSNVNPPFVYNYYTFPMKNNKQAIIRFDATKKLEGGNASQVLLEFYNTMDKDEKVPFARLYPGDYPPDVIASNDALRIVVNQSVNFKATISPIDAGCYATAKNDSDFYVLNGCKASCSWFISKRESDKGVVVIDLNQLNLLSSDDTLEIKSLNDPIKTVLKLNGPLLTGEFPNVYLDPKASYQLNVKRKCTPPDNQNNVVSASFVYMPLLNLVNNVSLKSNENKNISSINYPNNYPIISSEKWIIESHNASLLTLNDFKLAKNHQIIVYLDKNDTKIYNELPSDLLLKSNAVIELKTDSSELVNQQEFSNRGFKANLAGFDFGDSILKQTGSISTPNFPNEVSNLNSLVWIVTVPRQKNGTLNVIQFGVEYAQKGDDKNGKLIIYDSNTLRDSNRTIDNGTTSSLDTIIVTYSLIDAKKSTRGFNLTFAQIRMLMNQLQS